MEREYADLPSVHPCELDLGETDPSGGVPDPDHLRQVAEPPAAVRR